MKTIENIHVGQRYELLNSKIKGYAIISSYESDPSERKYYHAKGRKYYVHTVYRYSTVFHGRYFNLKDARNCVRRLCGYDRERSSIKS